MFFVMKLSKLCNLRCTYCYEFDQLGNKQKMPLEGLRNFLETLGRFYLKQRWKFPLHFVLHGGEPMLLPKEYIEAFLELQREYLSKLDIKFNNSLQTNLFKINKDTADFLVERQISLGVSFDVFGQQRQTLAGQDSLEKVSGNLQLLFDWDVVERLGVGGIAVLHSDNIHNAKGIYEFYRSLGLNFRMLPIFSLNEPSERTKNLSLNSSQVVAAFQQIAAEAMKFEDEVEIFPLTNFRSSAIFKVLGEQQACYDPEKAEWALIIDTDGATYNHGDAYQPNGFMGNIFTQDFADLYESPDRQNTIKVRKKRQELCDACEFYGPCSGLPIIEAVFSERNVDCHGQLSCDIAKPMISHYVNAILDDPEIVKIIKNAGIDQPSRASMSVQT